MIFGSLNQFKDSICQVLAHNVIETLRNRIKVIRFCDNGIQFDLFCH